METDASLNRYKVYMIFSAPVGQFSAQSLQSLQAAITAASLNYGLTTVLNPLPTSPRMPFFAWSSQTLTHRPHRMHLP